MWVAGHRAKQTIRRRRRTRAKGFRWGRRAVDTVRVVDAPELAPARDTGITHERYREWAADTCIPAAVAPVRGLVVEDVLLHVRTGVVSSQVGRLVAETSHGPRRAPKDPVPDHVPFLRLSPEACAAGTIMYPAADNYHHWICDCLPRLVALERVLGGRTFDLVVPEHLAPHQCQSLSWLAGPNVIVRRTSSSWVRVERLVWPGFLAPYGTAALPRDLLVAARDRLVAAAGDDTAARPRHLYLSRAGCRSRRVRNEDELLRALDRYGFDVIQPELLALAEQVRSFAGARLLVGPRGAGLANMVFSRELDVVELSRRRRDGFGGFGLSLAATLGHGYARVAAGGEEEASVVDPTEVCREVEAALAAPTGSSSATARSPSS